MKIRSDWAMAYEPYAKALRKLKLPRKYKRSDPRNLKRVMAIADTLRAVKARLRRIGD